MNALPKYVVTDTLRDGELTWNNTTRIPGPDVVARVRALREAPGGDLLVMAAPSSRAPCWARGWSTSCG